MSEEPKPKRSVVISAGHARGLRRQHARNALSGLFEYVERHPTKKGGYIAFARSTGRLAGQQRRPPSQGLPAGTDITDIVPREQGALEIRLVSCDKRGRIEERVPIRTLLRLSAHATEALIQRLRTQEAPDVLNELRPVGVWLLANQDKTRMEANGLLLSPSGVFPIVPGEPEGHSLLYWLATTWIADKGLAEDGGMKRRIADVVRKSRSDGMQVGFVRL